MEILVAIDDTDSLESRGTGHLAEILSKSLHEKGWGEGGPITRHQMLIHPDIPYTSHNSSMCFSATIDRQKLDEFIGFSRDFLSCESASGSDPGLCIGDLRNITLPDELIRFGMSAKKVVLTKDDAYRVASTTNVYLSEHGGTGLGIIGALAGVGLRLTGNDGRFKGHLSIGVAGDVMSVKDIKQNKHVEVVRGLDNHILEDSEKVLLGERIKTVLLEGESTLLVFQKIENEAGPLRWHTCTKHQLRKY
jgi:hypothetical protein